MSHQTVSEPWFDPQTSCAVILITGIQAAGKSTVAQLLAERLPRSVHVRGDVFRRMVINGRAEMTPGPTDEAVRQLRLRHQLTAMVIALTSALASPWSPRTSSWAIPDRDDHHDHKPPADPHRSRPAGRHDRWPRESLRQDGPRHLDYRATRPRAPSRNTPSGAVAR